ncbi:MAG: tetratricopeptide repeat protein [Candidatus Cybelea sp.]
MIELITSLVTKSLLIAESIAGEQRYGFLESTRHYAKDKLIARGQYERVARRHALACLESAERSMRVWATTPEQTWFSRGRIEFENWRAALDWALEKRNDVVLGQRLAAAYFWTAHRFDQRESMRRIRTALELVDEETPRDLVAKLEHRLASGLAAAGERAESLAAAQRALMHYRELGDQGSVARLQTLVASSLALLGKPAQAEQLLTDALQTARAIGDQRVEANILEKIGWARSSVGDFATARTYHYEALRLAKAVGSEGFAADVSVNLANMEFEAGNTETALQLAVDFLTTRRAEAFPDAVAACMGNSADYLVRLGRYDEAQVRAKETLDLARHLDLATFVADALRQLGVIAVLRLSTEHQPDLSFCRIIARIFGFTHSREIALGMATDSSRREYDRALAILRSVLSSDDVTDLMTSGAMMTEDEAIAQAHSLELE